MNAKMAEALHIKAYFSLTQKSTMSVVVIHSFQAVIQESKLLLSHSSAIAIHPFPTSLGSGRQGWNTSKPRWARTSRAARGTGKCGFLVIHIMPQPLYFFHSLLKPFQLDLCLHYSSNTAPIKVTSWPQDHLTSLSSSNGYSWSVPLFWNFFFSSWLLVYHSISLVLFLPHGPFLLTPFCSSSYS